MLPIAVTEVRSFHLDAPLSRCDAHFGSFTDMLEDLPELRIVQTWAPGRLRLVYSAAIADVYRIRLYSDVRTTFDASSHALLVRPDAAAEAAVPARATLSSLTAQGRYSSCLVLSRAGRGTHVRYDVSLDADLPMPVALRLLPEAVAQRIVQGVVRRRLRQVIDDFVRRVRRRLDGCSA